MAAKLELSDGVQTIDLMASPYFAAREVRFGALQQEESEDDAAAAETRYAPRRIEVGLNPRAASVSALREGLRSLERLCAVAGKRSAAGRSPVTLSCSLDASAQESIVYTVLSAEVALPPPLLQEPGLSGAYAAPGTCVRLLVAPIGQMPSVAISPVTIANEQDGTAVNYVDLTGISGTQGARLQLRLADEDAPSAAKPVWIASRSGPGYDDQLLVQGAEEESVTITEERIWRRASGPSAASYIEFTTSDRHNSKASKGIVGRFRVWASLSSSRSVRHRSHAGTHVGTHHYVLDGPPAGRFRVLVRWKHDNNIEVGTVGSVRVDWRFGTLTGTVGQAPYRQSSSFATDDLGELVLPPIATPIGYGSPQVGLDVLHLYQTPAGYEDRDPWAEWSIDYIALLPADEGLVVLDGMPESGSLLLDTLSDTPAVYALGEDDAPEGTVEFTGSPFEAGPEDTRIYVVRDDDRDPSQVRTKVSGSYTPLVAGV